ncbi:cadmium resistance transporter, partial [Secundilactobacillus collinoides]
MNWRTCQSLKKKIEEYRKWVIPLVFIVLGIYILIKNNAF